MGRTANYVFMAILLIVGLWSAYGIQMASNDIAKGNANIDKAAQMENEAMNTLDEMTRRVQADARIQHEAQMARGGDAPSPSATFDPSDLE